jgi:hypothetical protein
VSDDNAKPTADAANMQQHITAFPMYAFRLFIAASTNNITAAATAVIEMAANNIFMGT